MKGDGSIPKLGRWYRKRWGILVVSIVVYMLTYLGFRLTSESWRFRDNERNIEFQAYYFVQSRGIGTVNSDDQPESAAGFREAEGLLVFVFYPLMQLETALTDNIHGDRLNALSHHNYGRFTRLY